MRLKALNMYNTYIMYIEMGDVISNICIYNPRYLVHTTILIPKASCVHVTLSALNNAVVAVVLVSHAA